GTDLPFGPQEYVVVYQVVAPAVTVVFPAGGETLVPAEQELIRWTATDNNTQPFTAEFSVDGGIHWTVIHNNISGTARTLSWKIPSLAAAEALVRVSRNGTSYTGISEDPFTILGQPVLTA